MLSACAFYEHGVSLGLTCRFNERAERVVVRHGSVTGVQTGRGNYATRLVVNAAGGQTKEVAQETELAVSVQPDCHEAGITEPVQPFLAPMVVDIRSMPGSKNCYFHQHTNGQVIFCITPDPPVWGSDRRETSGFLPMTARRMLDIMPRLASIRVRRTWRGMYPMTPDGSPIVGRSSAIQGYLFAGGMCGQGFMLGPGVGSLVARLAAGSLKNGDEEILAELSPGREFGKAEELK
jgi:sarcosine oxidase subunit beta